MQIIKLNKYLKIGGSSQNELNLSQSQYKMI